MVGDGTGGSNENVPCGTLTSFATPVPNARFPVDLPKLFDWPLFPDVDLL